MAHASAESFGISRLRVLGLPSTMYHNLLLQVLIIDPNMEFM